MRASTWTVAGYGASQLLRLASNLILARLLFPEAFGLMALVNVLLQGLAMFSDIGIAPAIIRSPRGDDPAFLHTAWTMQIGRGILLWLASCALAGPVAWFYNEPMLASVLPVAGLTALVAGFNSTRLVVANRKLALGRLTVLDLFAYSLSLIVMVGWAWQRRSVWALVAGNLVLCVFKLCASHLALPGQPDRVRWDWEAYRELVSFGRWIFVSTLVAFLASQVDRLLLGKLVPLDLLGVYSLAVSVAFLPREVVARLAGFALYPSLAGVARRGDGSFEAKTRRARMVIQAAALPCTLALVYGSPWFFGRLYDTRYVAAAWIAQGLAFVAWLGTIQSSADQALLALGATRTLAFNNVARAVLTPLMCMAGHHVAGLPGFVAGMVLAATVGPLWSHWGLVRRGVCLWREDLIGTLMFVGLAAPAVLMTKGYRLATLLPHFRPMAVLVAGVLVLIPVAAWSAQTARREFAAR